MSFVFIKKSVFYSTVVCSLFSQQFLVSNLIHCSDSEDEANEVFEEAVEQASTMDETRRLAETWARRYSKTPEDKQNGDDQGERQEGEDEDEDSESYEFEETDEDLSCPEYESDGELLQVCISRTSSSDRLSLVFRMFFVSVVSSESSLQLHVQGKEKW